MIVSIAKDGRASVMVAEENLCARRSKDGVWSRGVFPADHHMDNFSPVKGEEREKLLTEARATFSR